MLAGDPKQLPAVVKSEFAEKLGHKRSLMERLFEQPSYKPNPDTNNYDPNLIVQLIRNYRSHPIIINMPNQLFYSSKLIPMAPKGRIY